MVLRINELREASARCPSQSFYEQDLATITTKGSPKLLEIYNNSYDYYASKEWGIGSLTTAFADLADLYPDDNLLVPLANAIEEYKKDNSWLYYLLRGFITLLNNNASLELLKIYSYTIPYYRRLKGDEPELTSYFVDMCTSNYEKEDIELLDSAIHYYKQNLWNLGPLLKGFNGLIRGGASTNLLKVFVVCAIYHEENSWDTSSLKDSFLSLIEAKPTPLHLQAYESALESQIEKGRRIDEITLDTAGLVANGASPEMLQTFYDNLDLHYLHGLTRSHLHSLITRLSKEHLDEFLKLYPICVEKNLNINQIAANVVGFVNNGATPLIIEVYKNTVGFLGSTHLSTTYDYFSGDFLHNCFGDLSQLKAQEVTLRSLNQALLNGHVKTKDDLVRLLSEAVVHSGICTLILSSSTEDQQKASSAISSVAMSDSAPYSTYTDSRTLELSRETQKVFDETLQVYSRAYDIHHGFGGLMFDSRKTPSKDLPLLARFGGDVALSTSFINAKDIESFPGRGLMIQGLLPSRIFAASSHDIEEEMDPYWKYKVRWLWAQKEFDDLASTEFIFTRGFIAVLCPENKKYELNGTHYSYIVFNDHFHNYGLDVAYLVPTDILRSELEGALIPFEDIVKYKKSFSDDHRDINEANLSPSGLASLARERKLPIGLGESAKENLSSIPGTYRSAYVLDLCWGSNIGGGLCNAYPPGSLPYHFWERMIPGTTDRYGHMHKAYLTDGISSYGSLSSLQQAHNGVYELTTRYQNLFDLFRLSYALWKKGLTLGETLDIRSAFDESYKSQEEGLNEEITEAPISDLHKNPNSLRMLIEAYKWHSGRRKGINDPNFFPVLTNASALNYWTRPESFFSIDTFDMALTIGDEKIMLNNHGITPEEAFIWYNRILPQFESSDSDLRFVHRMTLSVG